MPESSNSVRPRQRVDYIDISKGIGILLVVLGHLVALDSPIERTIYSFHMPFFFIVSGLFAGVEKADFKTYFVKKFKRLFLTYVFVYIVGIAVSYAVPFFNNPSPQELLYGFLCNDGYDAGVVHVGATWFLPCLFFVSVFFWLFHHAFRRSHWIARVLVLMGMVLSPMAFRDWIYPRVSVPFKLDVAFAALPLFALGYYAKDILFRLKEIKWYRRIGLALFCLAVVVYLPQKYIWVGMVNNDYGGDYFVYVFDALCGATLLLTVSTFLEKSRLLRYAGKNTLFILAYHLILVDLYSYYLTVKTGQPMKCQANLTVQQIIVGFVAFVTVLLALSAVHNAVKAGLQQCRKKATVDEKR